MKALIISSYGNSKTAIIFKEMLLNNGVEVELLTHNNFEYKYRNGKIDKPLSAYCDFVLLFCPYHKNCKVFEILKSEDVRVFNSPTAVEKCDDKWLCYQVLQNAGVPQMATYETWEQAKENGLLDKDEDGKLLKKVVVKDRYGSFGEKVHLASYYKDLRQAVTDFENQEIPYILQEFCETTKNRGARITCIGGKFVASYFKRTTDGDFVVNLHNNAVGQKWNVPLEFIKVAEKTAQTIGADYCGIDFMFGENDLPIVCEVNARAVFSAMEKINEMDIKGMYVDYIISEVMKGDLL